MLLQKSYLFPARMAFVQLLYPYIFCYNQGRVYVFDILLAIVEYTKIQSSWIITCKWNKIEYDLVIVDILWNDPMQYDYYCYTSLECSVYHHSYNKQETK